MADDAVLIGPPAASESYCDREDRRTPGPAPAARAARKPCIQGRFHVRARSVSRALAAAGIVFIGPTQAPSRRWRQDRIQEAAAKANVSTVPATSASSEDEKHAVKIADEIVSRDDQGVRRRRRQGHADRAFEAEVAKV